MTITRERIQQMRTDGRLRIDAKLEDSIITHYGEEPDGHEYTEQDLHEQIRKLIYRYNRQHVVHTQSADLSKPWDPTATPANPPATIKEFMAKTSS